MRVLERLVMALVGLAVLVGYFLLAGLGYLGLAWVLADPPALGPALLVVGVVTVVGSYLGYRVGSARLLAGIDAKELPRHRVPGLYRRRDGLCERMAVAPPPLFVADIGAPNALSIGGPDWGVVVLDRRLLGLLTMDELEGILAHELAHLERRDAFVQTLAVSGMRTLATLLFLLLLPVTLLGIGTARAVAWLLGQPQHAPDVAALVTRLVELGVGLGLSVFTLLLLAHSRRREFVADERAAAVTGQPRALARALVKIHRVANPRWTLRSVLTIHGEESTSDLRRLLSSHPPIEERLERLAAAERRLTGADRHHR